MPTLHNIVTVSAMLFLSGLSQITVAEHAEPIPVYLPVDNPQLIDKIADLNRDLLSAGLPQFRIKQATSWSAYQHAIREAQFGVFLAAPHYSAWAVRKFDFIPLLRIKEPLKYVLAVRKNDSHLFEINDLKNKTVCTQKPLNFDYLMISQAFKTSIHGADIMSVDSPQQEMLSDSLECAGFALSAHQFSILAAQLPDKFIRLHQSHVLNNYSVIAHPKIAQRELNKLQAFLVREQRKPALEAILSQFAQHTRLIPVSSQDYSDQEYQALLNYW